MHVVTRKPYVFSLSSKISWKHKSWQSMMKNTFHLLIDFVFLLIDCRITLEAGLAGTNRTCFYTSCLHNIGRPKNVWLNKEINHLVFILGQLQIFTCWDWIHYACEENHLFSFHCVSGHPLHVYCVYPGSDLWTASRLIIHATK